MLAQQTAFDFLQTIAADPASPPAPAAPKRDRAEYLEECKRRWYGRPLANAAANWTLFEQHRLQLIAILQPYLKDSGVQDEAGNYRNPDYTLTSWLWTNSNEHWWIWDFCDHYQRCHLRRGLIAYCKQIIRELEFVSKNHPQPPTQHS